jgi:hypothetical protein
VSFNWSIIVNWAMSDIINGFRLAQFIVSVARFSFEINDIERLWALILLNSLQWDSSMTFSLSKNNWFSISTDVSVGSIQIDSSVFIKTSTNIGNDIDGFDSSDKGKDCKG